MFLGLRTVIYHVGNLDRAKAWYGAVLGFGPYYDDPFYVGFEVGGFELGLQPDEPGVPRSSSGVTAYGGVEDAGASHARLVELGAKDTAASGTWAATSWSRPS